MRAYKKYILTFFLPFFLLILMSTLFLYKLRYKSIQQEVVAEEEKELLRKSEMLTSLIEPTLNDIYYLSNLKITAQYLSAPEQTNEELLIYTYKLFANANENYAQIRILDTLGNELIRINNPDSGIQVVPDHQLQNKENREYFKEALQLRQNQVYLSRIDLNMEHGRIITPYQIVLRSAMPVFGLQNKKLGIVINNLRLDRYLSRLQEYNPTDNKAFMLLNQEGYFLSGPSEVPLFGFMWPEMKNQRFEHYYPEVWKEIQVNENGKMTSHDQLFIFQTVSLQKTLAEVNFLTKNNLTVPYSRKWYVVSRVSLEVIDAEIAPFKRLLFLSLLISILFLGGLTFLIARQRRKEIAHLEQTNQLNKVLRKKEIVLRKQNIELKQKNKVLEQFVYITSHDLQEPLNTIGSFTEMLKEEYHPQLDETAGVYMDFIEEASRRMKEMITDLLDYTRIGQRKKLARTDLNLVVEEVQKALGGTIHEKKAKIHVSHLPTLEVYPNEMYKLFQNLLSNALKFTRPGEVPEVYVESEKEDHKWKFEVRDNGIGIDPKAKDRIFQMFQRLHNKADYPGTGIGLTNCKKIVELHGGEIWVESEPGKGSSFYFTIPTVRSPESDT